MSSSRIASVSDLGVLATLRRGVQISPQIVHGIGWTLLLAVLAAAGRVVVPLAVQSVIDHGILAHGGPDGRRVAWTIGLGDGSDAGAAHAEASSVSGAAARSAAAGSTAARSAAAGSAATSSAAPPSSAATSSAAWSARRRASAS